MTDYNTHNKETMIEHQIPKFRDNKLAQERKMGLQKAHFEIK